MDSNVGFVAVGYALTAASLGAYWLRLLSRSRRARQRATAIATRRNAGR